jgi:cytochrome d ubiquinol oxidase subunit II
MELNTLWFILIAVLYTGYFILEGFDFGVGILLPFLGKSDHERRVIINTIGPHWDGNEVWLVTAGGATFAAFPLWYTALFSGFYLPLLAILLALILRGVAFEFRSKTPNPLWRKTWDWIIFAGSLIPAVLWGVAFTNLLVGVPIDANLYYTGGFWNLLNGPALVGGLVSLFGFISLGGLFLSLKIEGDLGERARQAASRVWFPGLLALTAISFILYFTKGLSNFPWITGTAAILALILAAICGCLVYRKRLGSAFIIKVITIILTCLAYFSALYPNLMVSSLDAANNLTIANAASGPYTLKVMSIVAAIFVPIVMVYQAWSYWIFRKRLSTKIKELEY